MIFQSITAFFQRRLALSELNTFLFGTFCYLHYVVPYFLWQPIWGVPSSLMNILRLIAIFLSLFVILRRFWPSWLLTHVFPSFWLITVFYTLPFVSTIMFLATQGAPEWVVSILMATLLLIFLVDWLTFLFIIVLGCIAGFLFYGAYVGGLDLVILDEESRSLFFYQIIFGVVTGAIFSWHRKKETESDIEKAQALADVLKVKMENTTSGFKRYASKFDQNFAFKKLHKFVDKQGNQGYFVEKRFYDNLSKMGPEIVHMTEKTQNTADMFRKAVHQNITSSEFEIVSVKRCLLDALQQYPFEGDQKKKLVLDFDQDFKVKTSKEHFRHVIFQLLDNAFQHGQSSKIALWLSEDGTLHFKDDGVGMSKETIDTLFDPLGMNTDNQPRFGLAYVKMILDAFDAEIVCRSKQGDHPCTEFLINFPQVDKKFIWN